MDSQRGAECWLGGYWLLTSALLMLGPGHSLASLQLALGQVAAAIGLFVLSSWVERHPRWTLVFWLAWIPSILVTYKNLDVVQAVLARPQHDLLVQSWERLLWGDFQLWIEWSQRWSWLPFSELLHLCYLTYYLLVLLLIVRLLRRERPDLAHLALGGAVSSLLICYLIILAFPVLGPRPLSPPLDPALQGPFWKLCHSALKSAAAAAAAFPSGHTSLSVAAAAMGCYWDRALSWIYLSWAGCVVAATVYGRFHYTVDVLAGTLVGLLAAGLVIARDPDRN